MSLVKPLKALLDGVGALPRLILARLSIGILLLWAVSVLIFIGTDILPGDAAQAILGQAATPESVANLRKELGLDRPSYQRYVEWLGDSVRGDLGKSYSSRADISKDISTRFASTISLALFAGVVSVPLAIVLGVLSVRYHNSVFDKTVAAITLCTISLPEFFSGYLLILFLSVYLHWLPSSAAVMSDMSFGAKLYAMALPCATLVLVTVGHMLRMTKAAILNVLSSPYIETAQLKGLNQSRVIWRHALPNALSPIINVVGLNLAYLIVGIVVVEVIFSFPGMGQYMVDHVSRRDMPVVQACALVFAATYILINLVADVAATFANPRIRFSR